MENEPAGAAGPPLTNIGGIVLCGGRSTRMGRPKLSLPFGDETMLHRVVRILRNVVSPVVVVAAADQELPPLPDDVRIARDEHPGKGPLAGLDAGLRNLSDCCSAAYASSCDVPLLQESFVRHMIGQLGDGELIMPREGKFHHPLAAVYRTSIQPRIGELIAADRLRPFFLLETCDARTIDVEELRSVDPELDSLRNLNTPEEYADALRRAGLSENSGGADTDCPEN